MDVKFINPFIESTVNVLKTMANARVESGKPFLKKDNTARGDVSGIIGLSGEVKGTIAVTFTERCILALVSKMLGQEMTELNDDVKDAAGEIANIISGQARLKLEDMGRSLRAVVPTVIMGRNHEITHITTHPIIAIPFKTDYGDFTIEVCFEE